MGVILSNPFVRMVSPLAIERRLPVPSSTPAIAASIAGSGQRIRRPDLDGRDGPPADGSAVNTENRTDAFASGRHTHDREPAGLVTAAGSHEIRRLHYAVRFKYLAKIIGGDAA